MTKRVGLATLVAAALAACLVPMGCGSGSGGAPDLCAGVICASQDACHGVGSCDPNTGLCSNPAKLDGATCDDGDLCTLGDVCTAGSCAGTALTCPNPDQCHAAGSCNAGQCSYSDLSDGTGCTLGDASAGLCEQGTCTALQAPVDVAGSQQADGTITVTFTPSAYAMSYHLLHSTSEAGPFTEVANGFGSPLVNPTPVPGVDNEYVVKVVSGLASALSTPSGVLARPSAPSGLAAGSNGASVTLTWTESMGATSYTVYRSDGSGSGYGSLGAAESPFVDSRGTLGATYSYAVTASNGGGTSGYSNDASATFAPPAVTDLAAANGGMSIVLTWTAAFGATGYDIVRAGTRIATSATPGYTDAVGPGTTHSYVVQATNAGGTGASSNPAQATTVPEAPTGLTASGGTAISLSWLAPAGATGYVVRRGTTANGPYGTIAGTPSTPSFLDSNGLAPSTRYYYVVAATNAGGTGPDGGEASADVPRAGVRLDWMGSADGDWHDPSNWSLGLVPESIDDVVIDASVTVHVDSPISFHSLTLGDAAGTSSPTLLLGAGTVGPAGSLTIYGGATLTQSTTEQIVLASVMVHEGGVIDHLPNAGARAFVVNLETTGDFTLEQGARIALDGRGYAGGPGGGPGYGPGGGNVVYWGFYGGGAGHGGQGVPTPVSYGGNPNPPDGGGHVYDSETDPADLGSGGGTGAGSSFGPCAAGAGGGAVLLVVGGNLQIDGLITADGADKTGSWPCGGGAGGTINLTAASASGAGVLGADGGFGYGAGGGGRIAAKVSGAITASWSVTVNGLSSPYGTSQDGTTYFPNWPLSRIVLTPPAATLPAGTTQQFTAAGIRGAGASQPLAASDGLVWGVDDSSIASVDASGLLTTVACGETRVTASVGEVVGSAPLKVCSDVYVSTSGDDASGDGSAGSPYRTITFALSHSWPANTVVHLAPGTYSAGETFPLRPADGITLSGAGPNQTTIAGNVSSNIGPPVGIVSYGANIALPQATRIEGLTIANSGGSAIVIYFENNSSASISPVFRNNVLSGTASGGSPGLQGAVVLLGHAYSASVAISPTFANNTIHGDGMPALTTYALQGSTIAPTLTGNTLTAVYPQYASGAVTSVYLLGGAPRFERNTISATNGTAMWMFSYSQTMPLAAVFLANEVSWTPPQFGISTGIFVDERNSVTGSLVFSDNTIAGPTTAIQMQSDDGTGTIDLDLGGGASGSHGCNTIRGASDLDNSRNTLPVFALDNWWTDTPPTRIVPGPGVSASPANAQSLSFDVSPASGPVAGGTAVTLTARAGTFFVDDVGATHRRIAVTIGGIAATGVSVSADHLRLTAVTPAGSAGAAAVIVTNPAGQSGAASFTYEPAP